MINILIDILIGYMTAILIGMIGIISGKFYYPIELWVVIFASMTIVLMISAVVITVRYVKGL